MSDKKEITQAQVDALYETLKREAESAGYYFNPDVEFAKALIKGLLENEARYGYRSCPCRLASGKKEADRDIVCPCDYRDPDLSEHNACYCALYVSKKALDGQATVGSIPERRPPPGKRAAPAPKAEASVTKLSYPVWRCKVCGYLCAREEPPEICPICKVKKDRFERFM